MKKPTKPNLPLSEQPGFIPFPDDLNDFTFDLACAVLGGDPDGALRDIIDLCRKMESGGDEK